MILLPVGHDASIRRFPWVTVSIMALCLVLEIARTLGGPSDRDVNELAQEVAHQEQYVLIRFARTPAAVRYGSQQELLKAFRAGELSNPDDPLLATLTELDQAWDRLLHKDLSFALGYRPTMGLHPNLLLSAFVHSGWFHLLGNLLFLWLCGCNLEDRWGKLTFAGVYCVGAIAASAVYGLWHPGSTVPVVGASGAISAAMGAFLVCYYNTSIRFWYFLLMPSIGLSGLVRTGFFEARALFTLPLWFLEQLWGSWIESFGSTSVASSAHVGGFIVGFGIALAFRASGVERKVLLPASAKGVEWSEDPELVQALELAASKRPAEALALVRNVCTRLPGHVVARRELARLGIELGDASAVEASLSTVIVELARENRAGEIAELYRGMEAKLPQVVLSDRALAQVARSAAAVTDSPLAIRATSLLLRSHPQSPLIPASMWNAARLQEQAGRVDLATTTLEALIDRYPLDPFADQARSKLLHGGQPPLPSG